MKSYRHVHHTKTAVPRFWTTSAAFIYHMYIKEKEGWATEAANQRNWDLKRIWGALMTNTALFTENEMRGQSCVSSSTHVHDDGYSHRYWLWVVMDGWAVELGDNYTGYRRSKLPLLHAVNKHEFAFQLNFQENMYVKSQEYWIRFEWVCAMYVDMWEECMHTSVYACKARGGPWVPHLLFLIP